MLHAIKVKNARCRAIIIFWLIHMVANNHFRESSVNERAKAKLFPLSINFSSLSYSLPLFAIILLPFYYLFIYYVPLNVRNASIHYFIFV